MSRCKTLEGLVLSTPLTSRGIISDSKVAGFSRSVEENQPGADALEASKREFQLNLLLELFNFEPILKKLFSGKKIFQELVGVNVKSLNEKIDTIINPYKAEIIQVAEKFESQIKQILVQNPDIENNNYLQERIQKAGNYFLEKLDAIVVNEIPKIQLETDNKAIRKDVNKFIESLSELTVLKITCLTSAVNGFKTANYLEVRAKASIQPEKLKVKAKKVQIELPEEIKNPELYTLLKKWRDKLAYETNKPSYMILQIKSMEEMSTLLPLTKDHLLSINGFGKKKVDQYGTELLKIIEDYAKEHKLESEFNKEDLLGKVVSAKKKKEKKEPTEKIDTRLVSLGLFREGKDCSQIALERSMSERTIEGHLAQLIEKGDISVNELVASEKFKTIESFFSNAEGLQLSPAKEALGENYSWGELKYVASHIKYLEAVKS